MVILEQFGNYVKSVAIVIIVGYCRCYRVENPVRQSKHSVGSCSIIMCEGGTTERDRRTKGSKTKAD